MIRHINYLHASVRVFLLCLSLILTGLIASNTLLAQETENGRTNPNPGPAAPASQVFTPPEIGSDGDGPLDVVTLDDVIVVGSECVGQDCVNGESFGFDTIRLKENNLRIKFQDTSTTSSFPTNDWELRANDSSNGGGNYFAIGDVDGGRTPFRVDAGAKTDALRVTSSGKIGFGTGSPVVELHSADGDTPTLRLEQNGASGFTPQTWDIAGNEAGYFVRDVTNGSKLSFRIRPNSPTSSIDIHPEGVGVNFSGTPEAKLHVFEGAVSVPDPLLYNELLIQTDDTPGGMTVLTPSTGVGGYFFADPDDGDVGGISYIHALNQMLFTTGGIPRMSVRNDGTVYIGALQVATVTPSDRRLKKNIQPIDDALDTVLGLQGVRFEWINDANDQGLEIGLIAQDVEKLVPEVIDIANDDMGTKRVAYENMVALLIEAVKEQQEIINSQRATLATMNSRMEAFETNLSRIEGVLHADGGNDRRSTEASPQK